MRATIRVKMLVGFAAVLVLMSIAGGIALVNLATISGLASDMYDNQLVPITDLDQAAESLQMMQESVLEHLIATDQTGLAEAEQKIATYEKAMLDYLDRYSKTRLTAEEKDWLARFNTAWQSYKADRENLLQQSRQGMKNGALTLLRGPAQQKMTAMQDALNRLTEINQRNAAQANSTAGSISENSRNLVLALLVIALLGGIAVAFLLSRSISSAVRMVARAADGLAEGDVNQEVSVKSGDEIGQMAASFRKMIDYVKEMAAVANAMAQGDLSQNVQPRSPKDALGLAFSQMIGSLREMISGVSASAQALAGASQQLSLASQQAGSATQQISSTIQQVARGSQDQSTAIQDTAASVEQLTRAIDQIAKGAQEQARSVQGASASVVQLNSSISQVAAASTQVSAAAQQAHQAASSGASSVEKTARGMDAIRSSASVVAARVQDLGTLSNQIGSIVETIDDIAEQTNLLALNAAIEAARAGEHGRGFAVVADEVRKLAERASRSTKEIAALITQVQKGTREAVAAMEQGTKEVDAGGKLAAEAAEALNNILSAVQAASDRVAQITAEVKQMELASQKVVSLMDSVSAVVEQSTAATEQMAASSQQVSGAIEKVAAVSEETSAAAEEVSASTEEMGAQVEEMATQAQELAQMAEELQTLVAQFNLSDGERDKESRMVMRRRKDDWQGTQPQTPSFKPARLHSSPVA